MNGIKNLLHDISLLKSTRAFKKRTRSFQEKHTWFCPKARVLFLNALCLRSSYKMVYTHSSIPYNNEYLSFTIIETASNRPSILSSSLSGSVFLYNINKVAFAIYRVRYCLQHYMLLALSSITVFNFQEISVYTPVIFVVQ